MQPAPLEWAVVVAFYAAVHYVNAYLWERRRYEPRTHEDRENAVHRTADLRSAAGAYRRLRAAAYQARYEPGFRLQHVAAALLVRTDLEEVAERVRQALASTP